MQNLDQVRVLHVVGGTGCGGSESWLVNLLRHSDRRQLAMDFLVHSNQHGHYDKAIQASGAHLLRCLSPRSPWRYSKNFHTLLRQHGPYDVVHSHVSFFSGLTLKLAHQAGVPMRVAHSHHVAAPQSAKRQNAARNLYESTMARWIAKHATHRIAASRAAQSTLNATPRGGVPWRTVYCGIDLSPFRQRVESDSVRRELRIPSAAFVIGHMGRFVDVKNHFHLLETMASLVRRNPSYVLVLIGDGELRPKIEQRVAELRLQPHVRIVGVRADAPRLLGGAIDTFVFPSLREGLGLALVEAQAAGIRCITSTSVPEEATVVPDLVQRLPLAAGADGWAQAIADLRDQPITVSRESAFDQVASSHFNISTNLDHLTQIYRQGQTSDIPSQTMTKPRRELVGT